jgi:hypothetical protein
MRRNSLGQFYVRELAVLIASSLTLTLAACQKTDRKSGSDVVHWEMSRETLPLPPDHAFTPNVREIHVSPAGRLYVYDQQVYTSLFVYDSRGNFLRKIGRPGKGPGEFRLISTFGFAGDTLWVMDQMQDRITFFDTRDSLARAHTGILIHDVKPESEGGATNLVLRAFMPDGSLLVTRGHWTTVGPLTATDRWEILRIGRDGIGASTPSRKIADVVTVTNQEHSGLVVGNAISTEGWQPWNDSDLWNVASNGTVLVVVRRAHVTERPGTYQVQLHGTTGVLWDSLASYTPLPITPALIDSAWSHYRSQHEKSVAAFATEAQARNAYEKGLYRPINVPPIAAALVGNDSTVWLLRAEAAEDSTATWDIFDPRGKRFATAALPSAFTALAVSRDVVWGIEAGSDGETILVRYRARR